MKKRYETTDYIKLTKNVDPNTYVLVAIFKEQLEEKRSFIVQENMAITEDRVDMMAYVYMGEIEKYNRELYKNFVHRIVGVTSREYQIDIKSFVRRGVSERYAITHLYQTFLLRHHPLFSLKNPDGLKAPKKLTVITSVSSKDKLLGQIKTVTDAINFARDMQIMPPNICNSEYLGDRISEFLSSDPKIKVTTLGRAEIQELGMDLFLSVNKGSTYEPRLVIAEYMGDPSSSEKLALVGKGITYDSGGYSIKPSGSMMGMKYDMTGSVVVAAALKVIAATGMKRNVASIMLITDNRVNGDASVPDAVYKSYSGKTVEVNNTDAEGRLVLVDGLAYAIKNLKATMLMTVATLTGALEYCLGKTYAGFWATDNKLADTVEKSAREAEELVWRLPFHNDFLEDFRKSGVADMLNTNYVNKAGSSCGAVFLKEFTSNTDFVHFDIANTGHHPVAPLVRTISVFAKFSK